MIGIEHKSMGKRWSFLFLFLIFAWLAVERLGIADKFMLPSFFEFISTACQMFGSGEIQKSLFVTLKRLLAGSLLGGFFGIVVGSFCGLSKRANFFLEPLVYFLYPLPKFVFLPFIILFFGTGIFSQVFFIALGVFFPMAISMLRGIENINENYIEVALHYGARGWKLFKGIILPGSFPSVFSGLRISAGLALTYTIVNEFLTCTTGVGAMMWLSLQTLRIDKLMLGIFLVASLNLIFIFLIDVLEKAAAPWKSA